MVFLRSSLFLTISENSLNFFVNIFKNITILFCGILIISIFLIKVNKIHLNKDFKIYFIGKSLRTMIKEDKNIMMI